MDPRTIESEERQRTFLELLRPAQDRLESFALAMTRNTDDARDLVNETLLRAYEHFDGIRNRERFAGYLLTIASRLHKRRNWRQRLFAVFNEEHAEAIPDAGTAPDVGTDVEALYRALAHLPEAQREAVALFDISGLSLEEIQGIQGGSLSGVKSRLVRGRQRLARLLGVEPPEIREQNTPTRRIDLNVHDTSNLYFRAVTNE